jgi:hypothetical protein
MNQESRGLMDWLSWRPTTKAATATTATTATEAQSVATVASVAVAAGQRSYLWRIVEDGRAREVAISGCPSFAEVREWYPRALLTPINSLSGALPRPVWANETELRSWLTAVGETDADIINRLLHDYRRWGAK